MSKLEKIDVVGIAAAFIILEGALSLVASTDQRAVCNLGRLIRIGIGVGLVAVKW